MVSASPLEEYLAFVEANESFLPPDRVLMRPVCFKETYRSKFFGINRTRTRQSPALPTWDLFDHDKNELDFCYVRGQGIAGKIVHYDTNGQMYFPDEPGLEHEQEPFKVELLFLLHIETFPSAEQLDILGALQRLANSP